MPLIPPVFVQASVAFNTITVSGIQNLAYTSNVTQGNLLYVYVFGTSPTITGGNPTGDTMSFNSLSDSQGNTWFTSGGVSSVIVNDGPPILNASKSFFGVFFAFAKTSGPCTVSASWNASGADSKTTRLNMGEWKNVGAFDRFSSGFSTSNPAVTPTPAPSTSDNELYISGEGFSFGPGAAFSGAWAGIGWTQRFGIGSPSVGPVWDGIVGPTGGDITQNLTSANVNAATYWTSAILFRSATASDPNNGNVFLSQYPHMTWMKNVEFLCRDYWDQGLSSPYVGQIWPAPNSGGAKSGQTYPY